MQKPIIAIDADDTLFDENGGMRLYINKHYGETFTAEDYNVTGPFDGYWEVIWGLGPEEGARRFESFITSDAVEHLEPIPGALEALLLLKEDYELVIVTAREKHLVDLTHRALREHYPELFAGVHFISLWGGTEKATKAKICQEVGATILIDDNAEHCRLANEAGLTTFLFGDYGWNRTVDLPSSVVRTKTWADVLEQLERLTK